MSSTSNPTEEYRETLADYLHTHREQALYRATQLSRIFIESGLGPEDIIALHLESLEQIMEGMSYREQARASSDGHQFLLEVMIGYGVQYKEYLELKLAEALRDAELRTERERERVMEVQRLEREKSDFLSMIAHELRTPLTAAMGHVDLAARSLAHGHTEKTPNYLSTARQALERLSRLSADLVEASRGEPPIFTVTPQRLNLIVQQACAWAYAAAATKGLSLTCTSDDETLMVTGNGDALLSIFGNLLSNAVRYTPSGGSVTVHQYAQGDWAVVEVRDTGIGITPDIQARIFEKFYRGQEARSMEARGLGLGLSLVRQLVRGHDGSVTVESVLEQGSTFRVLLPISQSESEGDTSATA